jgi:hypothetical protein
MRQIRITFSSVATSSLAALLVACGGGGGGGGSLPPPPAGGGSGQLPDPATAPALKATLAASFGVVNFPVGAAIEAASTTMHGLGAAAQALQQHHPPKTR